MNCPFCHFPNEHNAPFCVNCGAPLPTGQSQAQQPPQPAQPQPPQPQPAQPQPSAYPPAAGGQPSLQDQAPLPDTVPPGTYGQPHTAPQVQPYPQPAAAAQPQAAQVPQVSQAAVVHPPRKKGKGCIIAVVVVGGLFLLLAIGAVLVYFLWYRSMEAEAMKAVEAEKVLVEKTLKAEKAEKEAAESKKESKGEKTPETKESEEKEDKVEAAPPETKGAADKNPILEKVSVDDLYQSQMFLQNDKIKYAGATISVRSDARLLSLADLEKGAKLKKGTVAVGIEIMFEGRAKMKKFKVSLIDGSGKKHGAEDSVEKYMQLPDVEGENHLLWRKLKKPKKKKTYYLHRGFSIPQEEAHNLIVEISNLNIDRALWVQVVAGK